MGLEMRPDGGLGTVSTSLPTGLEEGGGFYPKNDCGGWGGGVGRVMRSQGVEGGSLCLCVLGQEEISFLFGIRRGRPTR